jgi:hypothetical protein
MFTMSSWLITQVLMLPSPPFCWFRACVMAIVGQPFVACHHRSGIVNKAAMATPAAAQRLRTSRRDPPLSSAPRKIATAKKPMLCLLASPTPRDQSAQQPVAAVAGSSDAHHHQRERRPEHDVEGRSLQEAAGGQDGGHRGGRQGGNQLGIAPPAELAGQQPSDDHGGRHRQRRPEAQTRKPDSEQRQRRAGQQGYEDRLVDLPTLQMPGRVEKVQLVSMKAISPGQGHLEHEQSSRDQQHRADGKPLESQIRCWPFSALHEEVLQLTSSERCVLPRVSGDVFR